MVIFLPWIVLLATGVAYYAFFRSDTAFLPAMLSSALATVYSQPDQPLQLSSAWMQSLHLSFPSLIHAAAFAWLIVSACRKLNLRWYVLLAIHVTLCMVCELTTGTTSILDIAALLLGTFVAAELAIKIVATSNQAASSSYGSRPLPRRTKTSRPEYSVAAAITLSLSTVFTLATSQVTGNDEPVYLSYEQLRDSVRVVSPKNSIDADRVYLYDNYLILNERNQGLHVIDNSNPEEPENMGFIEIPGNTEVSIKSGFLYADSYVDLVTVDIRSLEFGDIDRIGEVNRVEAIFPYDEYQNVPSDVFFAAVDQERGVVIGYRSGR